MEITDNIITQDNKIVTLFAVLIVGAIVLFFVGFFSGSYSANQNHKQQAIDNGYAEYQIIDKYSGQTELVWKKFN